MVITPQQAKALTDADKKITRDLERRIDDALLNGKTTVDIVEYPGKKVIQELTQRYSKAGWHVKYESDQREGNYFRFEEWSARGRD